VGSTGGSGAEQCVLGSCVNPSPECVRPPVVTFMSQGVNTLLGNESDSKTALAKPNSTPSPRLGRTPREGLQLQVAEVQEEGGRQDWADGREQLGNG